jgi:hypothetical protein
LRLFGDIRLRRYLQDNGSGKGLVLLQQRLIHHTNKL